MRPAEVLTEALQKKSFSAVSLLIPGAEHGRGKGKGWSISYEDQLSKRDDSNLSHFI